MALTDAAVRSAKARDKDCKLADTGGLYLLVTPAGGKLWRLKYRMHGLERKLALGRHPDVSLAAARKARDAAREAASRGDDPAANKRREHVVPLSRQSLAILKAARELTGGGRLVFPAMGKRDRPMSENIVNAALRRMGFDQGVMTAHGFRAMASTLLNESGHWSADAIELALAHKDSDHVRAAYHRGVHWKERVAMAQWWIDHLDALRDGAQALVMSVAGR